MSNNRNSNSAPRRRAERNQNWVMWVVGPTVAIVMLFVCGVGGLILWRVADVFETQGGREQIVFEAPTRSVDVAAIPPPATPVPSADGGGSQPVVEQPERANEIVVGVAVEPTAVGGDSAESNSPSNESNESETINVAPTATLAQQDSTPAAQAPIATATIPPNGSVTAFRSAAPFAIDGDLGDWTAYTSYNATFRVYANANWDGTDDSEGFWRLAWDDTHLYIGVLVTDDTHVQTQTGNQIFRGDSLEMQIDTDRDGDYGNGLSTDDFQLVFSPGDFGGIAPSAFRFRASNAGQMLDAAGHTMQIASKRVDGGYTYEAAIPWGDLWMQPQDGLILGLSLNVNDNDTPNSAQQEMLKSHVSTRQYSNPSTWGLLILSER